MIHVCREKYTAARATIDNPIAAPWSNKVQFFTYVHHQAETERGKGRILPVKPPGGISGRGDGSLPDVLKRLLQQNKELMNIMGCNHVKGQIFSNTLGRENKATKTTNKIPECINKCVSA
jgi:hypothetical protein